jgi:hypothetical protein
MSLCTRSLVLAALVATVIGTAPAHAGDAYYDIPVYQMKVVQGNPPDRDPSPDLPHDVWRRLHAVHPYGTVEGGGELYVAGYGYPDLDWSPSGLSEPHVLICAPAGRDVRGWVVLPSSKRPAMIPVRFVVPARAASSAAQIAFRRVRLGYYTELLDRDIPGGAWFRHQVREAEAELAQRTRELPLPSRGWQPNPRPLHRRPGVEREPATRPRLAPRRYAQ